MSDPRHGTVAGYNRIPCREGCCKLAMANYKKRWAWDRHNGRERIVSTLGTRRRIESLSWLGWSRAEIAGRAGMKATNVARMLAAETMTASLAARFAAVYDELCMTLPTGNAQAIANTRNRARARGAVPPLAWDDIDDPNAQPHPQTPQVAERVDEVVVLRVLAGERSLARCASVAERAEIVARWASSGRPLRELANVTGWKPERYWRASA